MIRARARAIRAGLLAGLLSGLLASLLAAWMAIGASGQAGRADAVHAPAEPVDINRASVAELLQVPGMTASWAGRIVRFRPYRTKLDLVQLGVVPLEVYQRIRENVVAHHVAKDEQPARR